MDNKGKETYLCIRLTDAAHVCLGLKSGFGKHADMYNRLEKQLQADWDSRDKSVPFTPAKYEHVLVKSTTYNGFTRGIVTDMYRQQSTSTSDSFEYNVFLYDQGSRETAKAHFIAKLKEDRKEQLEPRCIIVHVPGIVPAKQVTDLAKQMLPGRLPSILSIQASEWSKAANRRAEEWLRDKKIQYLFVEILKTNRDESVYGNIIRLIDGTHEDLTEMLLKNQFGLKNDALFKSQMQPEPEISRSFQDTTKPALQPISRSFQDTTKPALQPISRSFQDTSKPALRPNINKEEACKIAPLRITDELKIVSTHKECDNVKPHFSLSGSSCMQRTPSKFDNFTNKPEAADIPGRLLVRGLHVKRAYKKIEEAQLPPAILKSLKTHGLAELSDLHKIVVPNVIASSDMIIISPDGGTLVGKSTRVLSYAIPVIRLLSENYESGQTSDGDGGGGPEAIIVCNSYSSAESVETFIETICCFSKHLQLGVQFVTANDSKERSSKHFSLPTGINILITTVNYLDELIQPKNSSRVFERLRFLIFEESELYLKRCWNDVNNFLEAGRQNLKISPHAVPFQVMFSGSRWTNEIEQIYNCLYSDRVPTLVITAVNSVIRYAKIKWTVHHQESEESRLPGLIALVRAERNLHRRIVITCSTPATAELVHYSLSQEAMIGSTIITSQTSASDLEIVYAGWKTYDPAVLVISDDMVREHRITSATCLICYDSPQQQVGRGMKRPTAGERFSVMWRNIRKIESEKAKSQTIVQMETKSELACHFLMTGEEHNFYAFYKFAMSLDDSDQFPESLKELALNMEQEGAVKAPVCDGIKWFGFCNNAAPEYCFSRHSFSKSDLQEPTSVPFTGEVEIRILKCINPSLYIAELLRHFEFEGRKRVCKQSYMKEMKERGTLMNLHYSKAENRQELVSWKEGTMCAVLDPVTQCYNRGKVEKVLTENSSAGTKTVRVRCLDSGNSLHASGDNIFDLPPEFRAWPCLTVNVILSCLKPVYGELEFRRSHTRKAKQATEGFILNAKVCLSIGNTIWVNAMVEFHTDSRTNKVVHGRSVRRDIIRDRIADPSLDHLQKLINSIKMEHGQLYGGYQYLQEPAKPARDDMVQSMQEFHQLGDDYSWAFVETSFSNKFDPVKIATKFGFDAWTFFGVHVKFENELIQLEKDLHKYIEEGIRDKYQNYQDVFADFYQSGLIVAAKERTEQAWMRAQILSIYEEDGTSYFDVYFVDYGDTGYDMTITELFPIPSVYVRRLPFQIIAFKLDHVKPPGERQSWEQSEKDAFLDLILPNSNSIALELVAMQKEDNVSLPVSCLYYTAMAIWAQDEIGERLVKQQKADFRDGGKELVDQLYSQLHKFYEETVSSALHLDDGEDDDVSEPENDFDVVLGPIKPDAFLEDTFNIKFPPLQGPPSISGPQNKENLVCDGEEPGPSKPVPKQKPTSSGFAAAPLKPSIQNNAEFVTLNSDGPSLRHPLVLWRQTDNSIILSVQLPDIQVFDIHVGQDKQTVNFKTSKPENYGFVLRLYGKIHPDFLTYLTGQCLKITFTKRMSGAKWVRVLHNKSEKFRWLKEDINYMEFYEKDSEDLNLQKFKGVLQGSDEEDGFPEDFDSTSDEDDDHFFQVGSRLDA